MAFRNDHQDEEPFDDGDSDHQDEEFEVVEERRPARRARSAPEKKGTSWFKIFIILMALGGASVAVCCGVGFYLMKDAIVTDPVKVRAMQAEIVQIDIPAEYSPEMGIHMNLGFMTMRMVGFQGPAGGGVFLADMQVSGQTEAQMEQGFRQQIDQQGQKFRIESSETKKIMVDGVERDFLFAKGMIEPPIGGSIPGRMISGMIPAKEGVGFIQILTAEAQYDEAQAIQMLESIRK